jgi:hypothetical protein
MKRIALRRGDNPRRPRGGSGTTPTYPFTILSLVPSSVPQGSPNTQIAANGVDFQSGSTAYVDGVAATTAFVSSVLINFTITAAQALVPGYKVIQIKRTTFASNLRLLAVLFPVPTLATATISGAGNTLNVTGTGWFAVGTHARIDDTIDAPFAFLSSTTGTVTVPQSVLDIPGTHTVRIFNDAPGGGLTAPRNFETKFKSSTLVSLSLTQQFSGRNAGPITLTGDTGPDSFFYPESVLKVDATPVAFSLIDGNHLSFTIPGALIMTPGPHLITVTNPTTGGGGGVSNALTFNAFSPTLLALSITEVVQYFDGFDVTGAADFIDANFEATYNDVGQPTTLVDAAQFVVHVTSAANSVPGTTMVRLRDTISGVSTLNAIAITVFPWDPSRLGTTLRLWLDGTSLVDDGAGKVASWQDKSGGARHCLPVTAGQLPTLVSSALLNNKPAARFASSPTTNLSYPAWLVSGAVGLINRDKYTIWVVAVTTSVGFQQNLLGDFFGYIKMGGTTNGPPLALEGLDSSGGNTTVRSPIVWYPTPNPFVLRQRKTATHFASRVKRDAEVVVAHTGIVASFAPSTFYIGSGGASAGLWVGDITEIIVCDTDVNSTHKAIMDNRLSYIYALPFGTGIGKPVITSITPASCMQYDLPFWLVAEDLAGGYTTTSVLNAFDTPLATEFLSAAQIRARVPNEFLNVAKGLAITVADTGGISAPTGLAILPRVDVPGVPNLHTTEPNTATQHGPPLPIRVKGVGFTAASVVKVNGVSLATTLDTGDLLATLPETALDVLPGPIITVSDPSGDSPNALEVTLTAWSPLDIPFLTGWWAADDVVVVGGKITQWNDKTGRGKHFVQADTAKQALYLASDPAFLGKPSAQFDGIDDQYPSPAGFVTLGTGNSVFASVYRYLVVDGAGGPTQPYVNDVLVHSGTIGVSAKLSPLTLIAYSTDGTTYRSASNASLVVGQTQRCQARITALSLTLEVGATVSAPTALPSIGGSGSMIIGYVAFGANNAINGKVATWCTTSAAWPADVSILWGNWCRYNYGTAP